MEKTNLVVKARDIYLSRPVFSRLNSSKISSATYALFFALNVSELSTLYEQVDEQRVSLIREYGSADEKTGDISVKKDNEEAFLEKFNELLDSELDVELYVFDVDKLDIMFKNVEITGEEISSIKYMVNYA